MASLFRDRSSLGQSKRESTMTTGTTSSRFTSAPTAAAATTTVSSCLPSPFGDLTLTLSAADLRESAYKIFVATCRTTVGKPLTYVPNSSAAAADRSPSLSQSPSSLSSSPSMQRFLTSTAASKMKKALGLRSKRGEGTPPSGGSGGKGKRPPVTVGELMRVQMMVSETVDSRIRRALLRIAAGQEPSNPPHD